MTRPRMVHSTAPLFLVQTKLLFLSLLAILSTIHCTCHLGTSIIRFVEHITMLWFQLDSSQYQNVSFPRCRFNVQHSLFSRWPKVRQQHCFPEIQASSIPCITHTNPHATSTCHDPSCCALLSRLPLLSCYIWPGCIYCWLSRAGLFIWCHSRLVSKVSKFHFSRLKSEDQLKKSIDVPHCWVTLMDFVDVVREHLQKNW